jgi:hypothetical protein
MCRWCPLTLDFSGLKSPKIHLLAPRLVEPLTLDVAKRDSKLTPEQILDWVKVLNDATRITTSAA